jgi:hypothetical protein
MRDEHLIGFWSNDMLYMSSMQDHQLYFGQRGEGAYAYLRPGSCRGAVFTWSLDGDRLTTRTVRQFNGLPGSLRRGDGYAFDVRAARVSCCERFAFQLGRRTRALELGDAVEGTGAGVEGTMDFAYMRREPPDYLRHQITRAHAYFDPQGGLPQP